MGLRSRLNRMGNPFDWSARKRRGSGQNSADAYDHHYFDDVDFPFGSTWDAFGRMGNKRHPAESADRSGFFDYVPQEFRQYVPESFGSHFRGHDGRQPHGHPHQQQQQQPPQAQQQQPPPQQPHQQQQAPPQQQQNYQQTGSKSNLCDAAIQTDDLGNQNNGDRRDGPNNTEHGKHFNYKIQYHSFLIEIFETILTFSTRKIHIISLFETHCEDKSLKVIKLLLIKLFLLQIIEMALM